MRNPPLPLEKRLSVAFDLHRFGVRMMRQNLRRRHPNASEEEIDKRLDEWLSERPLDGDGVVSARFKS